MERRTERRGVLDQSVIITLLKVAYPAGTVDLTQQRDQKPRAPRAFTGQAIDTSGKGMRLLVPVELTPGTTLKIETDNSLMLAEVCYCNRVNDERYSIGVEVSQSLQLTDQLRKLADAVAAASGVRQTAPR